ncbi:pentatricopeptide repeat protein, putative [Bodo saltans]|nr:pentatricopeptide repeat protein, putative [Bodo saltans]|eukprot:CUG89619.1 pentatricopeptide repeat protein, putative [Bodo saltans]
MMRWYAYSNNLKEVLALKEEMTKEGIYHSSMTYQHVFRVLDKHYPRMIEKYYNELRSQNISLDAYLYAALIRVFGDLGDHDRVVSLHEECKQRAQDGQMQAMSPAVTVQLIRAYRNDPDACERVIADAKNFGHLTSDFVQAELIQFYASHKRIEDMVRLVENLPRKSPQVFRVLLRDAAHRHNKPRFDALYQELRESGTRLNEHLFGVLVSAFGQFHDVDAISRIVSEARASPDIIRNSSFFAEAALAFAKVNQWALVDDCWERLLASKLSITMSTYNRFLDAYMSHGRLDQVQVVLNVMMQNVPPNPITATTVIDMLGKMGRLTEMEALLDEMSQSANALPTLVTYHQVMNAYAKAGDIHKLESVRQRLQQQGLVENHVTYNILAEGYGRAKRLEHLQELVAERRIKGIPMEEFGYVILLNIYSRAKLSEETRQLVDEMQKDENLRMTPRLQCTIATAFGHVGDVAMAEQHIATILASPDRSLRDVETICLIYSRLRDIRRLQQILEDPSISKTPLMYNVAIGAFAKAGEHSKVAILLQTMETQNMRLSRSTAVTLSFFFLRHPSTSADFGRPFYLKDSADVQRCDWSICESR